jgi:general secretion pathway protein B
MSLILDALNRAEHERKNQNAVPDINTLHHLQEVNPAVDTRKTLWWGIGLVGVLIAIIIALVVLLRQEPPAQQSTAQQSTAQLSTAQQSTASTQPAQQPLAVEAPNPDVVSTSSVDAAPPATAIAVVKTTPEVAAPNADINRLYATQDTEQVEVADTGVNELYAAEAATAAASETIVDPFNPSGGAAIATASIQEQAPLRTFESIKNIPDFNALPWNMRQQIPTISYARHNYLANGVSSVVINNQTTGVGNIIGAGQFIVQEIFVDGVILKHGNAVFKLRALTGWINM